MSAQNIFQWKSKLWKLSKVRSFAFFSKESMKPLEGCLTLIFCLAALSMVRPSAEAKPRQCIDKFEVYRNHTMCLGDRSQQLTHQVREEILDGHNNVRKNVTPTAKIMMEISYGRPLEMEAQTWADSCALRHDDPYFRFIAGRYSVGQNIYIGQDMNWTKVIGIWAREERDFKYNQTGNDKANVGNYTQMIIADAYLVGCGKRKCGNNYFYVCNYSPGILDTHINQPYEAGDTTVGCKGQLSNETQKLCSCQGKGCINGGQLDMGSCICNCVSGVKTYDDYVCELICIEGGDHSDCKTMQEPDCHADVMTRFKCPWLCQICPYAGRDYRQGSIRMPWETTTAPSTSTVKVDNSTQYTSTVKVDNPGQQASACTTGVSIILTACLSAAGAIIFICLLALFCVQVVSKKWQVCKRAKTKVGTNSQ